MAKILVVDDQAVNRKILGRLLGRRGHHVLEAGDGAEALAITRVEHPELVISDLLMPTMDGFELIRQLRAEPSVARTRVILYTGPVPPPPGPDAGAVVRRAPRPDQADPAGGRGQGRRG
jgi:CheY-like chemotaxis protein